MGHIPTQNADEAKDQWIKKTAGALSLLLFAPFFVLALLWAIKDHNGSVFVLLTDLPEFSTVLGAAVADCEALTRTAKAVLAFAAFEAVLFAFLPGTVFLGPVTPGGNRPPYRDNGFLAFLVTNIAILADLSRTAPVLAQLARDHLQLLVVLNSSALVLCLCLYFKGLHSPSWAPPDSGKTGNGPIFDYYWGTELHPRTSSASLFDFKQFINCRLGMMGWSVLLTAFLFAHREANNGVCSYGALVSFWVQQIYIAKFFLWERGYMASIDIAHDRLGFYIGWGCLVWLPSLYPSGMYHLYVNSAPNSDSDMPAWAAYLSIVAGVACIVITYLADEQRQQVRRDDAKVKVWGTLPRVIRAKYTSADGKIHNSILVAHGWWAIARHFHYITEWGGALIWTIPCAWVPGAGLLAWTYPIFLGILLTHRSIRDEERCSEKYGKYWKQYSKIVPYKIVPGIF